MSATRNTHRANRNVLPRLAPVILLVLTTVLMSAGAANASFPTSAPSQAPNPGHPTFPKGQPLENGPAVRSAPPFTAAPSGPFVIDPHWRSPNVKANTDATTFAQQEP